MNDRELLELAAKATGLILHSQYAGRCVVYESFSGDSRKPFEWNPLTDDGDALRLAVKLGLDVKCPSSVNQVYVVIDQALERINGDPLGAIRRAIVRAAAEIGRQMS